MVRVGSGVQKEHILDPASRGQENTGSKIPDLEHCSELDQSLNIDSHNLRRPLPLPHTNTSILKKVSNKDLIVCRILA